MTNIFIHIGTHKTGTTTIQQALEQLSAFAGVQEGWEYLAAPHSTAELMQAQVYDENLVNEFSKDLIKKIDRARPSAIKILSSEGLSGLPTSGYLNSGVVAAMLRDATASIKRDVRIVVYLRRQDEMVESMYTQKIHEGWSFEFGEFISQLEPGVSYNYSRILQDWISCFGKKNIIVRSYHSASQRGLLKDFGEIIGSTEILNSSAERMNPGYSCNALQIARIANSILDDSSKKILRMALQKTMAKQPSEAYAYFSGEDRKNFLDKYKASNQEVADLFFDGVVENMFPDPEWNFSAVGDKANLNCISHDEIVPLVVELLSLYKAKASVGIIAGAKVAISGYPGLKRLLQRLLAAVRQ